MALAWNAGWVNSPQGFESPILRTEAPDLDCSFIEVGFLRLWLAEIDARLESSPFQKELCAVERSCARSRIRGDRLASVS